MLTSVGCTVFVLEEVFERKKEKETSHVQWSLPLPCTQGEKLRQA